MQRFSDVNSDFLVARVTNYYNKGVLITPVMSGNGIELLRVENVTKKYEGKVVLDNISFTLKTGEILGLIGKSASGKSVLMHMIRGCRIRFRSAVLRMFLRPCSLLRLF